MSKRQTRLLKEMGIYPRMRYFAGAKRELTRNEIISLTRLMLDQYEEQNQ